MKQALPKISFLLIIMTVFSLLSGCINVSPPLYPEITPVPTEICCTESPGAFPSPSPCVSPSAAPSVKPSGDSAADALGKFIYGKEHFQQYLQFIDIRVYEDGDDTFLDCTVLNSYPEPIYCAVNIQFYDENGEIIASGGLQMPDGSFMLSLPSGNTPLYAELLTDISLLDKEFELIFDPNVEVKPLPAD